MPKPSLAEGLPTFVNIPEKPPASVLSRGVSGVAGRLSVDLPVKPVRR